MVFSMGSLAGMMDISGYVRKLCKKMSDSFFRDYSDEYDIFASGGVAICAGGFFFNDEMVKEHLPMYQGNMPLGCLGDDGSGIKLGEEVGATVSMMHKCTAWRFLVPPQGFASAICVDPIAAKRFSNEDVYNAKLIDRMFARAEVRAWIILDSTLYEQILSDINDLSNDLLLFQRLFALLQLQGIRKGNTWKELANACGLPSAGLEETVKYYNIDCHNVVDSNFGKVPKLLSALEKPPFYASWYNARVGPLQRQVFSRLPTTSYQWAQKLPILKLLSLGEKLNFTFPASPTFSLGGLSVDVDGHVLSSRRPTHTRSVCGWAERSRSCKWRLLERAFTFRRNILCTPGGQVRSKGDKPGTVKQVVKIMLKTSLDALIFIDQRACT